MIYLAHGGFIEQDEVKVKDKNDDDDDDYEGDYDDDDDDDYEDKDDDDDDDDNEDKDNDEDNYEEVRQKPLQSFNIETQQIRRIGYFRPGFDPSFTFIHGTVIYCIDQDSSPNCIATYDLVTKQESYTRLLGKLHTCTIHRDKLYMLFDEGRFYSMALSTSTSNSRMIMVAAKLTRLASAPSRLGQSIPGHHNLVTCTSERSTLLLLQGQGWNYRYSILNDLWIKISDQQCPWTSHSSRITCVIADHPKVVPHVSVKPLLQQ
ncbi:hypothetical protein SAMD00019534_052610 [Acytostelium subglobosum LB1]|uniref:hypothetical protein n=1 Tax=Acytostelium subglobosum LB1 TaxID=1410327 RepID=UPI000645071F|nr:hypothetical protein SAMD00019534_052610 [Acytostelium subglobosum LB1]GAM22086.1 hypothetical protein SAMD00019534_052610 [Acytostelium subglobosum LB1]|eukprot:XP_012755186.1 hypothetical protein SAMD00019534_052610 [Acytostelium subglobosum LB1]